LEEGTQWSKKHFKQKTLELLKLKTIFAIFSEFTKYGILMPLQVQTLSVNSTVYAFIFAYFDQNNFAR